MSIVRTKTSKLLRTECVKALMVVLAFLFVWILLMFVAHVFRVHFPADLFFAGLIYVVSVVLISFLFVLKLVEQIECIAIWSSLISLLVGQRKTFSDAERQVSTPPPRFSSL